MIIPDNANEYFWLFMAFVRNGEGEPFAIIESLNGFGLVNKDKPGQRKPEDMRLTYEGANAEGNIFGFRGYMLLVVGFHCSGSEVLVERGNSGKRGVTKVVWKYFAAC